MKKAILIIICVFLLATTYSSIHYNSQIRYIQSVIKRQPISHKLEIVDTKSYRMDMIYMIYHIKIRTTKDISDDDLINAANQIILDTVDKSSFLSQIYRIDFEFVVPNEKLGESGAKSSVIPPTRLLSYLMWQQERPKNSINTNFREYVLRSFQRVLVRYN